MEIKTGHFYVRNKWNKTYGFLKVYQSKTGAYYTLDDVITQKLERGTSDDLEQFEVIEELPRDYDPGYHEGDIRITVKNRFGHYMEFGAKNLLRLARLLEEIPSLAKALDIKGAKSYQRKKREGGKDKK